MKVALDTSAYAAFKRGHVEVIGALRRASQVLIPITVVGELLAGFEAGSRRKSNRAELDQFLASPRVSVVASVEATAERYAAIYAALRAAGTPIATNDLWIAAAAMEHGATLLTLDRAFLRVAQVLVTCFDP